MYTVGFVLSLFAKGRKINSRVWNKIIKEEKEKKVKLNAIAVV